MWERRNDTPNAIGCNTSEWISVLLLYRDLYIEAFSHSYILVCPTSSCRSLFFHKRPTNLAQEMTLLVKDMTLLADHGAPFPRQGSFWQKTCLFCHKRPTNWIDPMLLSHSWGECRRTCQCIQSGVQAGVDALFQGCSALWGGYD